MPIKIDNILISQHLFPVTRTGEKQSTIGEELDFLVNDDIKIVCHYFEANADSPVLLYFPAGTETVESFVPFANQYQKGGISIVYVSYRGYGKSSGLPCVSAVIEDANSLLDMVKQRLQERGNTNPLFIMGQSLGSVFAIDVTLNNDEKVKGIILNSSISSTREYLTALGVDSSSTAFPEEEGFNNLKKIENIKLPTIIFHGAKDPLVKVAEAESLQACSGARSKQFFVIPGAAHGDLNTIGGDIYYETLKNYLNTTCGVNTWRQRRRRSKDKK